MGNNNKLEDKIDEMLTNKKLLTENEFYWVEAIDKSVGNGQAGNLSKRQYAVICDIYRKFQGR